MRFEEESSGGGGRKMSGGKNVVREGRGEGRSGKGGRERSSTLLLFGPSDDRFFHQ